MCLVAPRLPTMQESSPALACPSFRTIKQRRRHFWNDGFGSAGAFLTVFWLVATALGQFWRELKRWPTQERVVLSSGRSKLVRLRSQAACW